MAVRYVDTKEAGFKCKCGISYRTVRKLTQSMGTGLSWLKQLIAFVAKFYKPGIHHHGR